MFVYFSAQPGTSTACTSLSKSHSLQTSSDDLSDLANSNKYYKLYIGAMKKEFFDMKSKVKFQMTALIVLRHWGTLKMIG